jgi:hypothetical protein
MELLQVHFQQFNKVLGGEKQIWIDIEIVSSL